MSWSTRKDELNAALSGLGYTRNKNNLTLREHWVKNHYSYTISIQTANEASNITLLTQLVTLEIGYVIMSESDYDTAVDSLRTVMTTIAGLSSFVNFASDGTLERLADDNKRAIGKVKFYFGLKGE